MTYSRRIISAALLALMLVPQLFMHAQTAVPTPAPTAAATANANAATTITVDGSNILSSVIKLAGDTYTTRHAETKIDVQVSGTVSGFEKLCAGTIDIAMAVRGISDQEAAACAAKNVKYVEVLLGYDASVIVVNTASKVTCLAPDEVNKLLGPTATNAVKNWNQIAPTPGDVPLSVVYVAADTRARDLISSLTAGNALRTDFNVQPSGSAVIDKVVAEPNAVAVVTLADFTAAQGQGKTIKVLDLKNSTICTSPNVTNLEELRYPAGQSLYLYVNVASLDRAPVADFAAYMVSAEGQGAVTAKAFTSASATSYTRGQNYLAAKQSGRTFSRIQSVKVPADTQGTITVDGAPIITDAIKAVSDAFQPRFTKITVKTQAFGDDVGYRKLCSNTIDLIGASRQPTDAETATCKANNIQTLRLNLGVNGVVLLVNGGNTFATCLTTDQIGKLIGADADGKVKKWSDADPKFPATDLLLVTPPDGANVTDLLLARTVKGVASLRRRDTTDSDDPLYRATGTANVEGALTYMTYTDYKKVKANVKLVQVDAGKGCVEPNDSTLADGSYPLAQSLAVVLNMNAFSRPEVKAFVWYLLSDDALTVLAGKNDRIGLDTAGFAAARDTALEKFAAPPLAVPTISVTAVATAAATAVH